ncbi:MAG TPA: hypothetical protein VF450_02345 [Noviherbaspirillum sp.]
MHTTSHLDSAGLSLADTVVAIHAPVDILNAQNTVAANDAAPLPFAANAIRMRDAYFDYELI